MIGDERESTSRAQLEAAVQDYLEATRDPDDEDAERARSWPLTDWVLMFVRQDPIEMTWSYDYRASPATSPHAAEGIVARVMRIWRGWVDTDGQRE